MNKDLILAYMVHDKLADKADLDVATFVAVGNDGALIDESRTYQQLWDNGQRIAKALGDQGLKKGESFGILMLNHPEFVDAMVGSSIAGTIYVPLDARTKGDKLAYMLDYADCKGIIVADYALANLLDVLGDLPKLKWVWVLDTTLDVALPSAVESRRLTGILSADVPSLDIAVTSEFEPMQMLYTSGTTGNPKAILSQHARFGSVTNIGHLFGLREGDRPYTGLSLSHANAQIITLGCSIKMGLRSVYSVKFTKSRLWDITRQYGCTMFNLLGGMTTAIYADPPKDNDRDNPVRFVLSAGMPKAIWNDFRERFDVDIFEFYGTAEAGNTMNPPGVGPVGSIGKTPPSMECTIRDDSDNEVPHGQSGEMCFRNADGSLIPVEYFNNPEASAEKSIGGWFRSGDIGHKDAEGWLFYEYRAGGGIRRNGDFVNPAFIEKAIAETPGVTDVFVYGLSMAHNAPGEKEVIAAIVPVEGTFDVNETVAQCREKLEAGFIPGYFQIVDEIPKTASEKPQERFLIEAFAADAENIHKI